MSEYLEFQFYADSDSGKTSIWAVQQKAGHGYHLGWVKWFGRWRQYCFFPEQATVYSKGCLEDIQKFIDEENTRRREKTK